MSSYQKPERVPHELAVEQLSSDLVDDRINAILSLALYDDDWDMVQRACLRLLDDPDQDVVMAAILAIGHGARRHGRIDANVVRPKLNRLARDPALAGRVSDALDDIETFATK